MFCPFLVLQGDVFVHSHRPSHCIALIIVCVIFSRTRIVFLSNLGNNIDVKVIALSINHIRIKCWFNLHRYVGISSEKPVYFTVKIVEHRPVAFAMQIRLD